MEQKWIAALRLARRYLPPIVLAQGRNAAVAQTVPAQLRNTVAEQQGVPPQERSKVVAQVVPLQAHNTAAVAVQVVAAAHYIALQAAHIVAAVSNLPVQEQQPALPFVAPVQAAKLL